MATLIPLAGTFILFCIHLTCIASEWNIISKYHDIKLIGINGEINNDIVNHTTLAVSRLVCANYAVQGSFSSFYYEIETKHCYVNNGVCTQITDDNNSSLVYGEAILVKAKKRNSNGKERFTTYSTNFTDCWTLYKHGFRHPGVYDIYPVDFEANYYNCVDGWFVFQRRFNGILKFHDKDWETYRTGFGNTFEEFWIGLNILHDITKHGTFELYIYLEAETGNPIQEKGYAYYSYFEVLGSEQNYELRISGYSGNIGDALQFSNGSQFSTYDEDHDFSSSNCAETYSGGWWYTACFQANLNGHYLNGLHSSYANGTHWSTTWGFYYSLVKTEMRVKC